MIFINHTEADNKRVIIIEIKGILDSQTSVNFEEYINQIFNHGKRFIILDAAKLEYVSSAGIGVMIYAQKKILASNGYLTLCNLSTEIKSLYMLLGFDKIFNITESRDEALKIMEKQIDLRNESNISVIDSDDTSAPKESLEPARKPLTEELPDNKEFDSPIILECAECKSMIRITKSGNYICPDCKTQFIVEKDQTVVF